MTPTSSPTRPAFPYWGLALYVVAAITFESVKVLTPDAGWSAVVKAIPALTLALLFARQTGFVGGQKLLLVLGALFCCAGDVILDIDRVRLFVPGLAAFLIGHLAFALFFWQRRSPQPKKSNLIMAALVAAVAVGLGVYFLPHLGRLTVPVLVYLTVISAMIVFSFLADTGLVVSVGAMIFMLSDVLIAVAKFLNDGVPSPEVTIPIYFLGLGIMGFGLIAAAGRTRTTSP